MQEERVPFTIRVHEADPAGVLPLAALCALLQEAAWRSAERLGVGAMRLREAGLAWVLHRLRVAVAAAPRRGDAVTVTTWPKRFDRAFALRDFEVHDAAGRRIGAATSRWLVVDLGTRRVVRLPDFVRSVPVTERAEALAFEDAEPLPPEEIVTERRFEVRRSDLDLAGHVNHTRLVDWALEAVPDAVFEDYRASSLDIVFRHEARYGDAVVARSATMAAGESVACGHSLVRAADGQELARARSRWSRYS